MTEQKRKTEQEKLADLAQKSSSCKRVKQHLKKGKGR